MSTSRIALTVACCFSTVGLAAQAQPTAVSNPRAIEFDRPTQDPSRIKGYRVEVFRRGADPTAAQPIKALDVARPSSTSEGRIRISLGSVLQGLPNGEYVVTLKTIGLDGESSRSAPTDPFTVSGQAGRVSARTAPLPTGGSAPSPPPPAAPATVEPGAPPDHERGGRFWTIVGIAMGAAAILVPFLAR